MPWLGWVLVEVRGWGGEGVRLDMTKNINFGEITVGTRSFYCGRVETILGEKERGGPVWEWRG